MSVGKGAQEAIRACKQQETGEDGVLDIQQRSAQNNNGGISVNITDFASRYHGITAQQDVTVVVHEDGVWIQTDE